MEHDISMFSLLHILSGCWPPPGLSFVTDPVCNLHGQDLKVQPGGGRGPVWGSQNCIPAFCR